jgi:hypothetical protein
VQHDELQTRVQNGELQTRVQNGVQHEVQTPVQNGGQQRAPHQFGEKRVQELNKIVADSRLIQPAIAKRARLHAPI